MSAADYVKTGSVNNFCLTDLLIKQVNHYHTNNEFCTRTGTGMQKHNEPVTEARLGEANKIYLSVSCGRNIFFQSIVFAEVQKMLPDSVLAHRFQCN